MRTEATVILTDGRSAVVETQRISACEGCHKSEDGKGCSVCTLMGGDRRFQAKAYNRAGAKAGDRVVIESRTDRMLWYAALVFLLPVVMALVFWGISVQITQSTTVQLLCALAGFVLAFAGLFVYSKVVQKKRFDIEITEIITERQ